MMNLIMEVYLGQRKFSHLCTAEHFLSGAMMDECLHHPGLVLHYHGLGVCVVKCDTASVYQRCHSWSAAPRDIVGVATSS